jgi:hypothetical protein
MGLIYVILRIYLLFGVFCYFRYLPLILFIYPINQTIILKLIMVTATEGILILLILLEPFLKLQLILHPVLLLHLVNNRFIGVLRIVLQLVQLLYLLLEL